MIDRPPKPTSGLAHLANFEGGVDELALAADGVLSAIGASGDDDGQGSVNPRLIRDYTQRGILSRPERQGKEAVYSFKHLVELVAARVLLADGWPLAKVSVYVSSARLEDLLSLATPRNPARSAMRAIRDIRERSAGQGAARPGVREPSGVAGTSIQMRRDITGRQARLAELRAELPVHLDRIGDALQHPLTDQYMSVSLASDLHILISDRRLNAMTLEEAEAIGKAVTASLIHLRHKGGKP
jgi:DNA-binding transcriptional MerR regulator